MGKLITLSIDLSLLDRARFKKVTKKSGTQGVYCDLVLYETENKQYGDFLVKQAVSKEERQQRVQMPILGNAKEWHGKNEGREAPAESSPKEVDSQPQDDGPVPF